MIQLSPTARVYIANEPVDFRNGITGLCGICRTVLQQDPLNGTYYVFVNKARTSLKILLFDGDGIWLMTKLFAEGRISPLPQREGHGGLFEPRELLLLIWRGDLARAGFRELWKRVM